MNHGSHTCIYETGAVTTMPDSSISWHWKAQTVRGKLSPIFVVRELKTTEIYVKMIVKYGDNNMRQRKVYKLVERLKGRQTSVSKMRSLGGRRLHCVLKLMNRLIGLSMSWRISTDEISSEMKTSYVKKGYLRHNWNTESGNLWSVWWSAVKNRAIAGFRDIQCVIEFSQFLTSLRI
jgi:hypothetical protein